MKVLHLSTSDREGGAGRAAYRLHKGFSSTEVKSKMLVRVRNNSDELIIKDDSWLTKLSPPIDREYLKRWGYKPKTKFSPQWFPDSIDSQIKLINPDLLHLHWICNGFVRIESLKKIKKPIVWTLHDMWPFTGGCHYSQGCEGYQVSCGSCPQLKSDRESDLSRLVWQRKVHAWKNINLTVVATSQWMAKCAHASSLFRDVRVEVIPIGLDTTIFKPLKSQAARELLDLPQEKKLILFGALHATDDNRKGFHLLQASLKRLSQSGLKKHLELIIFGSSRPESPPDLGFPVHYLGQLNDELSLRTAYAAADVMVAPSIEEAFGQTASESLACGTPVVVFKETGLADIVDHKKNGYVASYGDTEDLANGIEWVVENVERHHYLRKSARDKAVSKFDIKSQAEHFKNLYQDILSA